MRILLATKIPPYFERLKKPHQPLPSFQAQTFWLKALKSLGHQTTLFRYSDGIYFPNSWRVFLLNLLNNHFPKLSNKYHQVINRFYRYLPENYLRSLILLNQLKTKSFDAIIISGGVSELFGFPFIYANQKNIPIILLHGEDPQASATQFELDNIRLFDLIITNDSLHAKAWKKLGARSAQALPYTAIDPKVHYPKKTTNLKNDLVFIGTLTKDRQKILSQLSEFNLKVYGYIPKSINLLPQLKNTYHGEVWGKAAFDIYCQSKIALNLLPSHMPIGGNMRTFEIPGTGTFQLASRCPKDWFTPNKEIVLFNSLSDLKQKIRYYLKNNNLRKKIALAGCKRAHRDHTYKQRFKKILTLACQKIKN